jgi:hypothetical protein
LFLHFGCDYDKAQRMRQSDIQGIFNTKAYGEWKKSQEARQKIDMAVVERLDVLIKSIGNLAKRL